MDIKSILAPENTYARISATSKKRALEDIAIKLAAVTDGIEADKIFAKLINREKIGSTGIGDSIAIPHCRIDGCKNIVVGLFTTSEPIDFQAIDDKYVQVLFVLLVPTEEVDEHLQVLAMLANKFQSPAFRNALAKAVDNETLYQIATAIDEID